MKKKVTRDSRIELLRIIAMLMIVLSHFSLYGNWKGISKLEALQTTKLFMFQPFGQAAAISFFIITGFFSKKLKTDSDIQLRIKRQNQKAKQIWIETFEYSAFIGLTCYMVKGNNNFMDLIKSLFPLLLNEYWFVTCFILLMISSPYIDIVFTYLNNKNLKQLFMLLLFLQIPALLKNEFLNNFLLAIFGYVAGKLCQIETEKIKKFSTISLISSIIILYLVQLVSIFLLKKLGSPYFAHFTSFFLPSCLSLNLFMLTIKIAPFQSRIINYISKSVFAVYLITMQVTFKPILWEKVFRINQFQDSIFFPLIALFICIIIFLACICIDKIKKGILSLVKIS